MHIAHAQVEAINMFITKEELGSSMYGYQIEQITENDDNIVLQAISAATEEIRSYLTGNNMKQWLDGRIRYDVDAIFEAEGTARNPLILAHTKTLTKWHIVELCNADVIYEQAKERYDRSIKWLNQLAKGEVTLSTLPKLTEENTSETKEPFQYGSRKKFNHE